MSTVMPHRDVVLPRRPARVAPITRWSIGMLGLALLVSAGLAFSRYARDADRFPVSNVDVLGTLDYTDRAELRASVAPHVDDGFYGLDVDRVRATVEALPWVASARVSRVWPARLSIEIDEHEPVARWQDKGIVSTRVDLFEPPQLAPDDPRNAEWLPLFDSLPRLSGGDGRHADVFADFHRYARALSPLGVEIEALDEDDRLSQTLFLSNAITVRLGYDERARRLDRFIDIYERLVPPLEGRAARFDMRYSNGFALAGAEDGTTDEGEPE